MLQFYESSIDTNFSEFYSEDQIKKAKLTLNDIHSLVLYDKGLNKTK